MRSALIAATVWCSVIIFSAGMARAADDVAALLDKAGLRGGLCLVVGAKDTALTKSLAANSTLFVQVLQPDAKLAMQWGLDCSRSDFQDREKIGIRNAAFDPEHYGSDLFNLIVVDDAGALGKAKPADILRLVTPGGVMAFKAAPAEYSKELAGQGCEALSAGAFAASFRKAVKPAEWKVCDSFKWRAGPRAQLSSGWSSVTAADGKFFYRERMEFPGTLNESSAQLFARDINNGRVLWSVEEDKWRDPRPLAAAHGRVYTPLNEKLVCLDGTTGKLLFEILPGGLGTRWSLTRLEIVDDLLLAQGEIGFRAFSLSDGKELWRLGVDRWLYSQGKLITDQRGQITARSLKEPTKIFWQVKVEKDYGIFDSEKYLHVLQTEFGNVPAAVATLDMETGKTLWTYTAESQFKKNRMYKFLPMGDKLYSLAYSNYENRAQDLWMTRLDINTGKVEAEDCGPKGADPFNMCAPWVHRAGKYVVYFFSVWVDPQANSRIFKYLAHPSCAIGTIFSEGKMFNIPSRKAGALQGISAMAPADIEFNQDPGGKVLAKCGEAHPGPDVKVDEWPMFRANPERGNACAVKLGDKPVKLWEAQIGLGGRSFGVMSSERTGLTQAVCAYGLAIVSDIDAHRIVALDAATGKQKWVFPVGARVDYPPSLYKGLCIFAARDGWVHCLNATDGTPVWKLLIAPRERLIGGQEKLESQWPMVSDVLIAGGVCYTAAGLSFDNLGGVRALAFKPETGSVVWSQTYYEEKHEGYGSGPMANMFTALRDTKGGLVLAMGGKQVDVATGKLLPGNVKGTVCISDDFMAGDVSIPRNAEDRSAVGITDDRIWGKTVAFDKELSVAYANAYGGETWDFKGKVSLSARKSPGKVNLWENTEADMTVGDILLTPQFAYCVGHYQRVKKNPELLVVSREDGKVVNAIPVDGFPNFFGMSAAGNKIFVATRDGKLICYQGN